MTEPTHDDNSNPNTPSSATSINYQKYYSGTIRDSPWQGVVTTSKKETTTVHAQTAGLDVVPNTTTLLPRAKQEEEPIPSRRLFSQNNSQTELSHAELNPNSARGDWKGKCLRGSLRIVLLCDLTWGLMGIALSTYVYAKSRTVVSSPWMVLVLLSSLHVFRDLWAWLLLSMNENDVCHRCHAFRMQQCQWASMTSILSPMLIIPYLVMGLLQLMNVQYIQQQITPLLPHTVRVLSRHEWMGLWALITILQMVLTILLQQVRPVLNEPEQPLEFITLYSQGTSPSRRRLRRPWWWQHDSLEANHPYDVDYSPGGILEESLLPQTSTIQQPSRRRWSRFWPWSGRESDPRSNHHVDDSSVDFASVQEEWTLKSEQDPWWWTQENNSDQPAIGTHPETTAPWLALDHEP